MNRSALRIAVVTVIVMVFVVCMWPRDVLVVANEIENLIQPYADILGPPTTILFSGTDLYVWWGDSALILRRNEHWYIAGITMKQKSSVPPLFTVLMVQAMRARAQREVPTDPWGRPLPEEVLHPEVR